MSIDGKHFYRFTYLKSEEWRTVRTFTLAKEKAKCEICGKRSWSNDCHHKLYPDNIWKTRPVHLVVLCRECHDSVHSLMRERPDIVKWGPIKNELRIAHKKQKQALKRLPENRKCSLCGKSGVPMDEYVRRGIIFDFCATCFEEFKQISQSDNGFWQFFGALKKSHRPKPAPLTISS